jgi:hypothetical protein
MGSVEVPHRDFHIRLLAHGETVEFDVCQ